jgi:hypothetical protein
MNMLKVQSPHSVVLAVKGFGIAIVLALLTCPTVVGCQNPKAANKFNFAKAIANANLSDYNFCIADTLGPQLTISYFYGPGFVSANEHMDNLFVRAGLLTIVSQHVEGNPPQMVISYALTPMGRKFYKEGIGYGKSQTGFCYGKDPVVQVIDFTDPGPHGTNSTVTYTYRLHDVPTWLTGELAQEFRNTTAVSEAVYTDVKRTAHLTLMGSGWQVVSVE